MINLPSEKFKTFATKSKGVKFYERTTLFNN